ncbi:hypothetical protein [Paracoccus seriniphilus]|uniref:Uncharacterized protein n=1 Tax=Paracoccus seriniphilus TaxID=184748 RepID=A0A239PVG4_9RHOB|nr:hypothetical protein [Paracoccus seriniphilus]WCR13460.1 hypothetical protein JHW44_11065 [Paracoccus seriniphilus]SNT74289.1 hypothetical protein SAMN05444959_1073 [Paracoccus seriniphilus]
MFNYATNSVIAGRDPALVATRTFFDEHATAMLNAAALLGGPTAHRRCLRLLSGVSESSSLTRALRHELVWLHRLVCLDLVGDPETEETARFAMIDLLDPRVEEICIEADSLYDLLVTISDLDPGCDVILRELFDLSAA